MNGLEVVEELCFDIWNSAAFQQEMAVLNKAYIEERLNVARRASISQESIGKLLTAACHMSLSTDPQKALAAYKIALQAHTLFGAELLGVGAVCEAVFSRLANFIAIAFLADSVEDIPDDAPWPLALEMAEHLERNKVATDRGDEYLSDFQMDVWKHLNNRASVALAAPTSAGKSHVVELYLKHVVSKGGQRAVFIVPTRALISQVERNLRSAFPASATSPRILTTPTVEPHIERRSEIFVLTQERLHLLLQSYPNTQFNLVVVDEAQAVEDEDRGVLLASVLHELVSADKKPQMVFSMPFVRNPDVFANLLNLQSSFKPVKTLRQQVAQNYFVVTVRGRKLHLDAIDLDGQRWSVSTFETDAAPGPVQYRRLALSAAVLGSRSTLVYAPGPPAAESTAEAVSEYLNDAQADDALMQRREDLSKFLVEHIHTEYIVAKTVLKGVGCHYGPMPALARLAMERAFKEGYLNILTTTSTLLFGVNLPARDIFVLSPKRGQDALTTSEFWNLIGRAGRLTKELDGNVFLVDYDTWDDEYLKSDRERDVAPADIVNLDERGEAFAEYIILAKDKETKERVGFNGSIIRLLKAEREGMLHELLHRFSPNAAVRDKIEANIGVAKKSIELSIELLSRNPTLNPYRQNDLYIAIRQCCQTREDARALLPRHPLTPNSRERLGEILQMCIRYLEGKENEAHTFLRAICHEWMAGSPLPKMIDTAHEIIKRKKPNQKIGTTIRNVLKDIETEIGYRCVREIGCYRSILQHVLSERYPDLAENIVDIPLYLEFGASSNTMIACMTLGMSRITAGKVTTTVLRNNNLSAREVLDILKSVDLTRFGLSAIIRSEIDDALIRYTRTTA